MLYHVNSPYYRQFLLVGGMKKMKLAEKPVYAEEIKKDI